MRRIATTFLLAGVLLAGSSLSPAGAAGPASISGGLGPNSTETCPQAIGPEVQRFLVRKLHGKRLGAARVIAGRHDCSVRVVRRNGEWLAVTADYSSSRINVGIEGKKRWVTRVYGVG